MKKNIQILSLVDESGNPIDFIIKRIEDVYEANNGIADLAHRHNYYTLILVEKGNGKHTIDFTSFNINFNSLHVIYPGQVHSFVTTDKPSGWVFNFTSAFLMQHGISNDIINKVYLYNSYGDTPPLSIKEEAFGIFLNLSLQIESYYKNKTEYHMDALGALLKLIFINAANLSCVQPKTELQDNIIESNLLIRFKKLIEIQYAENHKVNNYADQLSVNADYLNKYVRAQLGKSAKELIQDKILVEAKRQLIFSDMSNKELAFYLGFEEPAHFSNFFKKYTSTTPKQFKLPNTNLPL